jgi:hypothetical protein
MTLFPLAATTATFRPVAGVAIPDSKLAREVTELVKDTESPLLFHHSSRVYYWGALTGKRRGLRFDPELLYAGAMFHDMGLTPQYASADKRFEVDSANTARDFLRRHGIDAQDIQTVWTAIALHTTPGIPQYMHPVIALVTAGGGCADLLAVHAAFIARRLSPGGCADLLAVTDLRRYGAWLFRSINQAMPR